MKIVLDTNVIYAAMYSDRGNSFEIIRRVGTGVFDIAISVGLALEYEEILKRHATALRVTTADVDDLIDYLCSVADRRDVFFLWRPCLSDPDDDMLLELAVAARCDAIVTFNVRDFRGAERFGLRILTPREFLWEIES